MPYNLQAIRFDYPTNPYGLHGRCGLDRRSRIQLDVGNPRQRLLFPPVHHRTSLRENGHRKELDQI